MKRKSILMTIVAVFFASVAWGQQISWPQSLGPNVVGADTIYFCVSSDSLYPIEFGYDVLGKQLHPSFGDWHLASKTSSSVTVDDYDFGSAKNGGAGNAFKTVGSGIGGILFEYLAKDPQCGLGVNQKFWAYVFILPQEDKIISPVDTFVCYKENNDGGNIKTNFATIFAKDTALYRQAGFTYEWTSGATTGFVVDVKRDSVAKYTFRDTLVVAAKQGYGAGYTCGDSIPFLFKLTVDSVIRDTIGKQRTICATDTLGSLGERHPLVIFQRSSLPAGAYYSEKTNGTLLTNIKGWTDAERTAKEKHYHYRYTDCNNVSHLITDTLKILTTDLPAGGNVGIDTVNYCRIPGSLSVIDLYNQAWYMYQPVLDPGGSDSYWQDMGIDNKNTAPNYGTTTGTPSLIGHTVNFDIMKSSLGYYYKWNVDNSVHECFVDQYGNPGWGTLVVILQDPFVAQDYTAQLCRNSYSNDDMFNLNTYTGLAVNWSGTQIIDGVKIEPNDTDSPMLKSTYKYTYVVPPTCGAGGKGVLYVKITDNVKVPVSKTVKYCIDKLPAAINLDDVLGVAIKGLQWNNVVTGTGGMSTVSTLSVDEFINNNTLVVGKFFGSGGSGQGKTGSITFTVSSTPTGCGVTTSTQVTLDFTGTL